MLSNYLKIAWRNLLKNKTFSFINIFGLAIGFSSFILIGLYVIDELSFDDFHEKADRIYRLDVDVRFGGTDLKLATSADPVGEYMKKDYPEVEQYARLYANEGPKFIRKGSEYIREADITYADSTIFDVFTFPVLAGNPKLALDQPNTAVVSETTAKKYFGTTDVLGKTLEVGLEEKTRYNITAVMKDMPASSHFHFDILLSMDNLEYQFGNFLSNNFHTYVVLKKGTDYHAFENKLEGMIIKYVMPQAKQLMNINSLEEFRRAGNKLEYHLMPMTDIHLKSDRAPELGVNGSIQYVYIFSAVALFVLLLACINFMNLSTARSANRAKEVGIRKVLGTPKGTLMSQFMAESAFMSYLAFGVALLITWLVMPYFNDIAAKAFTYRDLIAPKTLPVLLLLPLVVGMLAGYYPAFFLSSFRPIVVLKSKLNTGVQRSSFRNVLVTFQFFTSILLVIGTIVVYRQLNFIQTKNLGFNKDQVLVINGTGALRENKEAFKKEILKLSGVQSGASAGFLPVANSSRTDHSFSKESTISSNDGFQMQMWNVDYDYVPTLGMELLKGRNFSKQFGTDSSGIIINETAAKVLGFDDPIGKRVYSIEDERSFYHIVGVVKNFHFESMRQNVGPLCMRLGVSSWAMAFKVKTSDMPGLISQIKDKWKAIAPEMPFNYSFLDERFDEMYRAEQRVGKVAVTFAIITIVIACLGLFGLVTYMAEQRTKEVGIRKVLGASVLGIVSLLTIDFIRLIVLALLIASPIAYLLMNSWLQDFTYRINLEWWFFVLAGLVTLAVAMLTVSYQAIKAALMNPVKSLKSE